MRKINLIVIHCSATRVTQDFTVGELEACHLARGFRDIGYHYYITKDGVIYPCRPESEPGAHARVHLSMSRSGSPPSISTYNSPYSSHTFISTPQSYVPHKIGAF